MNKNRVRAIGLIVLMVLSTTLAAFDVSASHIMQYPVARDPVDLATGDFDCDGDEDIVSASDMGNFLSILWNDGGTYQERSDIWASNNLSRRAGFTDIADVVGVEVGDIDDDGNDDIIFHQGNIQVYGSTEVIRGNLTVLTNPDCGTNFVEDAVHTVGDILWNFQIGDVNGDGVDDIVALELQDLASGTQRLMTYLGGSQRNNAATNHKVITLDNLANKVYADIRLGNFGETVAGGPISQDCEDLDAWLWYWPGYNPATGFADGDWDNVSIIEFNCVTDTYSAWNDPNSVHNVKVGVEFGEYDIADQDGDGVIDMVGMTNGTNVTYMDCPNAPCASQSNWVRAADYPIGDFYGAKLEIEDVNQDGDMDFVIPTYLTVTNLIGASGNTVTSLSSENLEDLNTVQIILSDGSGGYLDPQSMPVGRRPTMVLVGQFAGGPTSALDLAVGNRDYIFGYSNGALHLDTKGCAFDPLYPTLNGFGCGIIDAITIVQLDNEDVGISGMSVSPASFNPDTGRMTIGEGTRDVNVTVQNTGLNTISGSVDVEVAVKEITGGTDTVVYSNDWETPAVSNCGTGCNWGSADYDNEGLYWHEEIAANHSATPEGYEADVNRGDYMWAGLWETNATSGALESGYYSNQDEAVILTDVDLTGADSAELELDLFCSAGYSAVHYVNSQGAISGMVIYDDSCNIDVYTDEAGWEPIVYRGGYDLIRYNEFYSNGGSVEYTSRIYHVTGTNYSWINMTGNNSIDLTPWAGDIVDIRFRFRTGYDGSVARDNTTRNTQWDGFAFDNLTVTKTVTAFGNVQNVQQQLNLNNLKPGDEEVVSLSAYFVNDTEYMLESLVTNPTGFTDEDDTNDDTRWKMRVLNLYDPAVNEITSFDRGQLYAAGDMPIDVIVENAGNTIMDFGVEATVYTAQPNALFSNPCKDVEDFEPSNCAYMFGDDSDGAGGIYDDTDPAIQNSIVPGNRPVFGSNAYWFGHPDTGYGDDWNESMTLQTIDLRNMGGEFAYLTFDYFADSDYLTDSDGDIVGVNEYAAMEISWRKGSQTYQGTVYGSWNDYNENGILGGPNQTCEDIDDDGIFDEVEYMGDHTDDGNYIVWFDSEGIVKSVTLDLTHIVLQNRTGPSTQWRTECTSMDGAEVDLTFRFLSNGDGINGQSGFAGFAMDNITVQEYTFTPDQSYNTTVTNIDAREERNVSIGTHNFQQGIYRVDVMSVFDNQTAGNNWTNVEEVALGNNLSRVIFEVASVDVTLFRPNILDCVEDVTYDCVYPIDQALTHQFTVPLSNGVLAGDYNIHMDIVDVASGSTVSSVTSTNSPLTLEPHESSSATFQPYNGWADGSTYDIRFYATLSVDGTSSGNMRNFTITFADTVDVAILSNPTDQSRLQSVKEDLSNMGLTYTQYRQGDWNTYLESGWLDHYSKVLLPWQTQANVQAGGYYDRLGESATQTILENFMLGGGTIEVHLGPYAEGLDDKLLYNMVILNRDTAGNRIEHGDINLIDPYHPLLDNVSATAWLGMNNGNYVANAALSTTGTGANKLPTPCGGLINSQQGTFHSLIQHQDDSNAHLLATCGIGQGGLIVTTIDVENPSVSEPYGSTIVPLRSNLLDFQVTPVPIGFGIAGNGWDMTINGEVPTQANGAGVYDFTYYMKSDAELTFDFNSDISGLDADWELRGDTDWNRNPFPPNVDYAHRADDNHSAQFCLVDQSPTGCRQDATWVVTLFLHDDEGHTRVTHINLQTNDILADSDDPVSNFTVEEHPLYPESLSDYGTYSSGGTDWPMYMVKLSSSGDAKVKFNACESYDPDAADDPDDSGITLYEWKVYEDYPWDNPSNNFEGHTFERTAAQGCDWTYTFYNSTANPQASVPPEEIRVQLTVEDRAGRDSDKVKAYFIVVPENWGDEAPDVVINTPLPGSTQRGDYVIVNGSVLSGSENGDVSVEIALDQSILNDTLDQKLQNLNDEKYDTDNNLGDGDSFSLELLLSDLYSNESQTVTIYIKIIEGNGQTHRLWKEIDINLPPVEDDVDPCVADPNAAGCSGSQTQTEGGGGLGMMLYAGIGAIVLLVIVILTMLIIRSRGSSDVEEGFTDVGDMDPMEAYVQQLIAQGYPEETARQYAQQYAGHFQQ